MYWEFAVSSRRSWRTSSKSSFDGSVSRLALQLGLSLCLVISVFAKCTNAAISIEPSAKVRLNSVGYLPTSRKVASIASECLTFSVNRASDDTVVFQQQVTGPRENADTEEQLYFADFTALSTPGEYYLDVPYVGRSSEFRIAKDLYQMPFHLVTRAMYLWRCGTAIECTHNGHPFSHEACHLKEGSLELAEVEARLQSSPGGWHDAGDYNKYVVNGAMTVGVLLWSWEDFSPSIQSVSLDLPERESPLPEFLCELKWELDWLLTMQSSDGSVYAKLSTKEFCGMVPPEADTEQQFFAPWSSDATADFVAVMAQASRSFRPYDDTLAERYLQAALKGYAFLTDHPKQHLYQESGLNTGRYVSDDRDERLWAAAEIWDSTGKENALADLEQRLYQAKRSVDFHWDWHSVRNLGVLRYLRSERVGRNQELVERVEQELIATADRIVGATRRHGYARPLGRLYYWGCNGSVARQALLLHAAYRMTRNDDYCHAALDGINHLLGRNHFGRSFVTSVGFNPPIHPHDRRSASDDVAEPWPGYLIGGPHPKATDWRDTQQDYRTNEIAINWNGALIYALAMFLDAEQTTEEAETWGDYNFNRDWRFRKGDHPQAKEPKYDDSRWRMLRLPHDWAIEEPFDPNLDGATGRLPWRGLGWYRKSFPYDGNATDRVYLEFDGVMAFPEVYVNGQLAGRWDYGYTSFIVDITPFLKVGQDNVVAVRVDTRNHFSRWYPGAGIYRKVQLKVRSPIHFALWRTTVTTPSVSAKQTTVRVESTIENHSSSNCQVQFVCTLLASDGTPVGVPCRKIVEIDGETAQVSCEFTVNSPQLWDVGSPQLYRIRSELQIDGRTSDQEEIPFGIRTFKFTANDGFYLNGRRVQLHGVNLHHDLGVLGAAFNRRAMQRRLNMMKDMGVNAIRTSHNPAAPELLDLCDEMGLLVWNECFDKWDTTAGRVNGQPPFEPYVRRHIRNFVRRDRNHPSIVVWSIGNEILNQPQSPEGKSRQRVAFARDEVLKHDKTRPVGMACFIPETSRTDILKDLDLTGWNYLRRYWLHRISFPECPIIYSESASTLSSRGFYELPLPLAKSEYGRTHQISSFDLNSASWSDIPDVEFQRMEDDDFVAGEFVWTGFDYLGEPTPFEGQARSSYFGIVDLCDIPKDRFYLYRSLWRPDTHTLHVLPHWNWPNRVGQKVPVFVYTDVDSAELFLNGVSQGKRFKGVPPAVADSFVLPNSGLSSSSEVPNDANLACDGDISTRWCAANSSSGQWWETDLGQSQPVKYLVLDFEHEAKHYGYEILVSDDREHWTNILSQDPSNEPRWGGPRHTCHPVDFQARYIRIEFSRITDNKWASLREFSAYPCEVEHAYYLPTYKYRLRWNDVVYEPGELKVVAYNGDQEVGSTSVFTAGKPTDLRLTPDRNELLATGEDLCYVLIEAVDERGIVCPLADNVVRFRVEGPGEIVGAGNGNPLSMEPLGDNQVSLFHGKAMLVLRTKDDVAGKIILHADSDDLQSIPVYCQSLPSLPDN